MNEGGIIHQEIKKQARLLLMDMGFIEDEIYEEFEILIGRKKFIVDLVGINENKKTAIECGTLSGGDDRLIVLRAYFDDVKHLPYSNEGLIKELKRRDKKINKLEKEVNKLNRNYFKNNYDVSGNDVLRKILILLVPTNVGRHHSDYMKLYMRLIRKFDKIDLEKLIELENKAQTLLNDFKDYMVPY